jgi:ribonuclease R
MATATPTSKNRPRGGGDNSNDRLRRRLLKVLSSPDYQPMNKSELVSKLDVSPKKRQSLRHILADLESSGQIRQLNKGRYAPREGGGDESVGILKLQPAGHAFVDPERGKEKGIFIPPNGTGTGLHGDKVLVRVQKRGGAPPWTKNVKNDATRGKLEAKFSRDARSSEGRVIKVLERRNDAVIATFRRDGKFAYAQPDDPMLPPTVELDAESLPEPPPEPGEKVVVAIRHWESTSNNPRGEVTEVLGSPDTPGIDMLQVIYARRLPREFPDAVLAEAAKFADHVTEEDLEGREDWRERPVFTIDPDTAKDFDDAILVQQVDDGYQLAVHIADVSHYVRAGSKLDREARERGNSTYLADRVIPMLPEALSNGLCSLVPDEDRLTHTAIISFDHNANFRSVRFCKAVIRSARRFTYKQAYALLKKPDQDDSFSDLLEVAWELASKLRKKRFNEGGLDLDMPEVRAVLDDKGRPTGLERIEYDESHQLIEEFMLAANEAVAKQTKDKLKPSIYRSHDDPDADKLFEYRQLAKGYGINVGDLSNRKEIQKLLAAARGRPEEHAIKVGLLKSLKRATYDHHPEGHYGLAKVNYTHFTSPIRRYADLVVHRVLASITGSAEGKTPPVTEMVKLAQHLSDTERNSADAENETQKLKQLEFLWGEAKRAGKKNPATHPALVHEVRRKGLFIELTDYFIKGLVAEPDLPECSGGYWFDGTLNRFVGTKPKRTFQAGDTIEVAVAHVDFGRRMVDFRVVE